MPLGPLPSLGPFGRVVDVRVYPHGFSTQQSDTDAGPAGSAVVRPNLEDAAWHAATSQRWGGNILWTGSTPRHTVAYNGPRGRYFGPLQSGGTSAMRTWFAYNGARIVAPSGLVLGACVRVYDDLPTAQVYTGTGDGTLTVQAPSTAPGALTGDYEIRCTGTAPAQFLVTGPDAVVIGVATAGVLFDGPVRFLVTPGAVPFALGDTFTLTVEEAEQFVVVTVPLVDGVNRTETVYRRGVSQVQPWRLLATLAPVAGQVGGSLQPWFFNAAASQAGTVRGLGADGNGYTLGVVRRALSLGTVTVTDTVETSAPATYTKTYSVTDADASGAHAITDVAVSNSTGPARQLMAVDYDGDQLVRVEVEFDGYMDGTSSMVEIDGQTGFEDGQGDADVSAAYSAWADLVWTGATEHRRLRVFELSASGAMARHWPPATDPGVFTDSTTEALTARVVRDVIDPRATRVSYTEYVGTQVAADDGTGRLLSGAATHMRHWVAGTMVADVSGSVAPSSAPLTGAEIAHMIYVPGSPEESYTTPQVVNVTTLPCMGVGPLGSDWRIVQGLTLRFPFNYGVIAAAGPPAVSSGRGYQTGATDTRGNWLVTAEVAAPAVSLWPGSFPGSGTYTDAAGGPDGLTPATVASLTGHPGDDRWDVGVF